MIEQTLTGQPDLLEFRITAPVTAEDYETTLMPAIDEAIVASERVRMLIVMEAGLGDYTLGAMMDDSRVGLKHWRGFDRVAVATGSKSMARAIRAFAVFIPCPVMVFAENELDDARRWLRESLGAIHQTDLGDDILQIELLGQLDSQAYESEVGDIDAFIRSHDKTRLLIDLRKFDGWQGLGALADHFRLMQGHAVLIDKAAIVGDAGWQKMAVEAGRRMIGAQARYFDASAYDDARTWLAAA